MLSVVPDSSELKTCRTCNLDLPIDAFFRRSSKSGKRRNTCKACMGENYRKNWLVRAYGITIDDYNRMYEEQNGCCAICQIQSSGSSTDLYVDHCHASGKVRKLLCNKCNLLLGQVGDNVSLLSTLVTYLNEHQAA
jgi:hypothetical protein